jgi:hypothetical protein
MSDNKKRSPSYDEWERICDENDRLKAENERLEKAVQEGAFGCCVEVKERLKSDLAQAQRERDEAIEQAHKGNLASLDSEARLDEVYCELTALQGAVREYRTQRDSPMCDVNDLTDADQRVEALLPDEQTHPNIGSSFDDFLDEEDRPCSCERGFVCSHCGDEQEGGG